MGDKNCMSGNNTKFFQVNEFTALIHSAKKYSYTSIFVDAYALLNQWRWISTKKIIESLIYTEGYYLSQEYTIFKWWYKRIGP